MLKLVPDLVSLDASCPPHFDIHKLATMVHGESLVPPLQFCIFVFHSVTEGYTNTQRCMALNRLDATRCEIALCDTRMTLCIYSVLNQVDNMPWVYFKQRQLEDWSFTPTAKTLEKCGAHLTALLRVMAHLEPERVLPLEKD